MKAIIILLALIVVPVTAEMYSLNYPDNGSLPGNTNIRPGDTNILVFTIRVSNPTTPAPGSSNDGMNFFPRTYSIDFLKAGLDSRSFKAVHFYYSTSPAFSLATAVEVRTGNATSPWSPYNFTSDLSPNNFGANNYCYMGPDLYTYVPGGQTLYYYMTVDMQTNMPDNTTFAVTIPGSSIFNYAGHDFYVDGGKSQAITPGTPPTFRTDVNATRLLFTSVPVVATKTVPFAVRLLSVDDYANWDKDFARTAQIYFMLTNVAPTPWSPTMGSVVNHIGNKANYTAGITNLYNNQVTINNAGLYQIIAVDGLTGVTAATSATIIVQPDMHHFDVKDQAGNNLGGYTIRAGRPISNSGINFLYVYPRDAVGNAYTNFTNRIYFSCDDPRRWYRMPYDGDTNTLPHMPNTNGADFYKFAASTNHCATNISGSNFIFYNAGTFNFSVIAPNDDVKSDFLINVTADDPVRMVPTVVDTYKARDPMKILLTLYDQYTNEVSWFSGAFSMSMTKLGTAFTNYTIVGPAEFSNGRYQGTSLMGPYVREPGDYVMTFVLTTNTNIYTNFAVRVTLNADETSLALGNNYITPGSAVRSVEIFGQNKGDEAIEVMVTIYDSSGRRVRSFDSQNLLPRSVTMLTAWDLKNNAGALVKAGLYLVRIQPKDSAKAAQLPPTTKKIVIVK